LSTKYTFILSVHHNNNTGYGSISFVTNTPPAPGHFVVKPSIGVAFSTTFNLQAVQWEDGDGDLPLKYQFGFRTLNDHNIKSDVILSALDVNQFFSTMLPSNPYFDNKEIENIECFVIVVDSLYSSSYDKERILVHLNENGEHLKKEFISDLFSNFPTPVDSAKLGLITKPSYDRNIRSNINIIASSLNNNARRRSNSNNTDIVNNPINNHHQNFNQIRSNLIRIIIHYSY
jgi:hypothetical protein